MNETNPPKLPGRTTLVAAVALVLIVGLGVLAVTMRGNNNDDVTELDVAVQPDDAALPTTAPATGDVAPTAAPPNEGGSDPTAVRPVTTEAAPTEVLPHGGVIPGVAFGDTASPVGGAVKKATLSGPETGVLVMCDQAGFEPFLFTDQGMWVGCQLPIGATAGGESAMLQPVFGEVAGPVGGTVGQLIIPGPQESVIVECEGDFTPFLFADQGTWIGCERVAG